MNPFLAVTTFYQRYIKPEDRIILWLAFSAFCLGCFIILLNHFTYQFPGNWYTPKLWTMVFPIFFILMLFSMYASDISPRPAFFTKTYTLYFFICLSQSFLITGIQYTPFPTIDPLLVHLDKALGFNTVSILSWLHPHLHFRHFLEYCYDFIYVELFLIPPIMALFMDKKILYEYFFAFIIATFAGITIYYLFPTMAPSSMFNSPFFAPEQHATALKFFQLHNHIAPTTIDGGMIAFPSMHVVWAVLCLYVCKNKKWLFYPILLVNIFMISATVLLGWHYLVDVFGSLLIVALALYWARSICTNLFESRPEKCARIRPWKVRHLHTTESI